MKRKSEELEKDDELKISQKPFLRPTFPEGPPTKKEKYQIYEWSSSNLSAIAKENQIVLNLFGEVLQEYKEDFAEEDLTQVYELEKAVLQEFEDYNELLFETSLLVSTSFKISNRIKKSRLKLLENSKTIQSLKNECEQLDERNKEEDVEEKKLDKAHEFLSEVASKFSQLNPPKNAPEPQSFLGCIESLTFKSKQLSALISLNNTLQSYCQKLKQIT